MPIKEEEAEAEAEAEVEQDEEEEEEEEEIKYFLRVFLNIFYIFPCFLICKIDQTIDLQWYPLGARGTPGDCLEPSGGPSGPVFTRN